MSSTPLTNASLWAQGNNWSFTGIHRQLQGMQLLPNMQLEHCMILQGTLGGNFDIFTASGESNAWVLLWKTGSRTIVVMVCPVAQFNFFSTAFDPRAWTVVAFWKENLGRQPQLITPENERGILIIHLHQILFFFRFWSSFWSTRSIKSGTSWTSQASKTARPAWITTRMATSSITSRWQKKSGERNALCERLHPQPSPPEPQFIPIPMSDGEDDDDQPPQAEKQRQRSRLREWENPHVQVPQAPPIHFFVITKSGDDVLDDDFAPMNPSSPSTGPPPSA